ncbi:hypothetical protein [Flexivirga lutea]
MRAKRGRVMVAALVVGLICSLVGAARAPVLPAAARRRRGAGDIRRSAEKPRHLAP